MRTPRGMQPLLALAARSHRHKLILAGSVVKLKGILSQSMTHAGSTRSSRAGVGEEDEQALLLSVGWSNFHTRWRSVGAVWVDDWVRIERYQSGRRCCSGPG